MDDVYDYGVELTVDWGEDGEFIRWEVVEDGN